MSLLSNLVGALAPSAKSPDAPSFRALLREQGRYRLRLDHYAPYAGDHEPPDLTTTTARAGIVARRVLAVEAERVARIGSLLEREGVPMAADAASWDAIGRWLADRVEGSREPGSDRYSPGRLRNGSGPAPTQIDGESTTQLRPLWRSIAFDTALLLGRRMIAAHPGAAWTPESALKAHESSVRGEPLVALPDGTVLGQPFEEVRAFLHAALLARLGLVHEPPAPLGDAMRRLARAGDPANRPDPAADFIDALEELVSEYGEMPGDKDLKLMLADHGLDTMPPLPPHLDALRRTRGRTA